MPLGCSYGEAHETLRKMFSPFMLYEGVNFLPQNKQNATNLNPAGKIYTEIFLFRRYFS